MRNLNALRMVARALLCFACAGLGAQTASSSGHPSENSLVLEGLGKATLPLDGEWQFHRGDDPSYSSPQLDDSAWQPIQTGKPWEAQGYFGYTGFAWYRRHITLAPGTPAGLPLALLLTGVQSSAEIYWNGRLAGSFGKVPPHPVWFGFDAGPLVAVSLGSLPPGQTGVLAIRVWKAPILFGSSPAEGGLARVPVIGSAAAISAASAASGFNRLQNNLLVLALDLLTGGIGLLCLLAWLRSRTSKLLLWLALVMLFPAEMYLITTTGGLPFRWSYGLIGLVIGIYNIALWPLLIQLLGVSGERRLVLWTRRLCWTIIALDLVDLILMMFDIQSVPPRFLLLADVLSTIPAVCLEFWSPVIVIFALRNRLDAARWMVAISALLAGLLQGATDVTGLGTRWTHWTINERLSAPIFSLGGSPVNAFTLTSILLLISVLYAAWRASLEQAQRQSLLESEYRSAQELQQVLIPEALPAIPAYKITAAYRPAQEVGGDFFQLVPLPGGAVLAVIGDVSGKGLKAAMAVAMLVGAIRSTVETSDQPADILAALNRRLHGRLGNGFATCLALRLDSGGNAIFANAGHLPPFCNDEEISLPPALPLGLDPDAAYESTFFRLPAGAQLTLYTDGLLEARNPLGELYGFDRLRQLAYTRPTADHAAEAAIAFGQDDDITILTLAFNG